MYTASIRQIPKNIFQKYGNAIDYKTLEAEILKRRSKKIKQFFYNKETDSYGPFEGKQAIDFLQLLDYEASL